MCVYVLCGVCGCVVCVCGVFMCVCVCGVCGVCVYGCVCVCTRSVRKVSDRIFLCEHLMDYNLARLHEPTLNLSAWCVCMCVCVCVF